MIVGKMIKELLDPFSESRFLASREDDRGIIPRSPGQAEFQ